MRVFGFAVTGAAFGSMAGGQTWLRPGGSSKMANYIGIRSVAKAATAANAPQVFARQVIPALINIWLGANEGLSDDVVQTTSANFSYLFDVGSERLIAAWGISSGRIGGDRDASRMRQFPLSAGQAYHRGHAIPHRLGGALDINLVPQLGRINIGPFRELERRAVATPGALYFTFWNYRGSSQTPSGVDQGLLIPGQNPEIATFGN
jgi:hypothetical protein